MHACFRSVNVFDFVGSSFYKHFGFYSACGCSFDSVVRERAKRISILLNLVTHAGRQKSQVVEVNLKR